jgi:hypothetical protein
MKSTVMSDVEYSTVDETVKFNAGYNIQSRVMSDMSTVQYVEHSDE